MPAFYNENDPKAAAWLRELIRGGHIADGVVDERSIEDILPSDLIGYTQCHFFAGIGGWSYALRLAGWPDARPVWTGSCPCQPFSAAGKGLGFADERHLWPAWFHLVRECRPSQIFGEQVANALPWFDLVSTDLEAEGYTVGACIVGAHSVSAPHIRQRLYWVADAGSERQQQHAERDGEPLAGAESPRGNDIDGRGIMGNSNDAGSQGRRVDRDGSDQRAAGTASMGVFLEHAKSNGRQQRRPESNRRGVTGGCSEGSMEHSTGEQMGLSGCARQPRGADYWAADYIPCTDGKTRPVEPGTFPLAHGVPGRVGLLRGYGNAIVPQVAAAFIGAYLEL